MGKTILNLANNAFQKGSYKKALELYREAIKENPSLSDLLSYNLQLASKKSLVKFSEDENRFKKIIVYTCNFGEYETVKEPLYKDPDVEYILFTDNKNIKTKYWRVILVNEATLDARRMSRLPKILPHKYLPPHDISVYIDSSLEIKEKNVRSLVESCLKDKSIALYKHYKRDCVYDEIDYVMKSSDRVLAEPELSKTQIEKYKSINYPRNKGLYENAFIVRKNVAEIQSLNELWWKEYAEGTERDQFVLMYALHKTGVVPNAIDEGEQFRKSPFVNFYKHNYIQSYKGNVKSNNLLTIGDDNSRSEIRINWIVGGEDNKGWAYENNAKRFIKCMPEYQHELSSPKFSDVAVYFDVLLYDRYPVASNCSVLRIGGPRPLDKLCNGDPEKLKVVVENFHSVICLNKELAEKLKKVHPNVHVIPNGIDLDQFSPSRIQPKLNKKFTVGFAASVKSSAERDVKGLDLVIEACNLSNVQLLNVGRGKNQVQIPHENMIGDFYSQIDVLVHPVSAGREGSSNVVMEALALGIPVITTEHSGYHAEQLTNNYNFLLCKRNARHIAGLINVLKTDTSLRKMLSINGRDFAKAHHDINSIAKYYRESFLSAIDYHKANRKICFSPFWYPIDNFATGRIRSSLPAKLLNSSANKVNAKLGYDSHADIAVISQLANDEILKKIIDNKKQFIIYDICDKYYLDNRDVGGVNAKKRFFEIAERANLIVTSTLELKKDLYNLNINKPIVHIQDGIDFQEKKYRKTPRNLTSDNDVVGWFGNPGRGNLESAAWMLEESLRLGKSIKLITKVKSVKKYPKLYPYAIEWNAEDFIDNLQKCNVIVVSHASNEQNKSPNRMLTAISNYIPVIAYNSKSCEEILRSVGLEWAVVKTPEQYSNALSLLSQPEIRHMYFKLLMPYINDNYGNDSLTQKYLSIVENYYRPLNYEKQKILFVSHNLSAGEGAPTSLFQTVIGLKKYHQIDPYIFCPMTGDFKSKYEENNIPLYSYTKIISKDSLKPLNANFKKAKMDFQSFIKKENFDLVVCNTAKMLPYVNFSVECGIPAISIIRESSNEHIELTFSKNKDIIEAAEKGLKQAKKIIFVSDFTRKIWKEKQFLANTEVIHNGIITKQWEHLNKVDKVALRESLGLPANKNVLLSVGTINARKAQIDIINAFKGLPKSVIDNSCLVLVGARDSEYLSRFKEELNKLPEFIRNNILLIPETEKVGEWYKAADIFVFSSHNESYPRVIVEALYFELVIVSSKVFGVKEQLVNSQSSFLYDVGDIEAMQDTLLKALASCSSSEVNQDRFYDITDYQLMLTQYCRAFSNAQGVKK